MTGKRPNILLIVADDLGSEIETPHLDKLAREGIRFSDCKHCRSSKTEVVGHL
jgi:arylsulfatase A-like enzyme